MTKVIKTAINFTIKETKKEQQYIHDYFQLKLNTIRNENIIKFYRCSICFHPLIINHFVNIHKNVFMPRKRHYVK